ncbi:ABC transporter ATP-binding protein [Clostridium estertheticum]|uniref:Multidrug ABC transporter ATP-binding protein n=1 Tax=Clostridium estertheticum subsp. estertheticum TaxID=1552 RepID=A0A1J0GKI9_9CLOT|nr:ATP-binding cassette domain-containing protein [Clostridium estertheticum]APC41857.1 multidrug ABC transporter ATP-binding protein [Clostridium estertheticum subsp. estertheticum]MBU3175374.1 ATP-binding cassette domain-containing protein [Clostridium estertheticum]MBZ9616245.1 ATP-binding cassette domain-containing protein [Clostridium estertheticum subsp. laramiense]MCB2339687.1 ATP-binding cassette domain-containing protein [Clostridium estertheticum]WAG71988.1 ATP-binding cassette domai
MSYIEIKNLTKIIKGNKVLDNININLSNGKIYGFIGRNGSGKTMLFRAICGLIRPTTGEITINGKIISNDIDFPESCGAILETPGFWDNQTGLECLKNIASIKSIINKDIISQWMLKLGLDPKDRKTFKKYSLGMKQKLALVQALMESPNLIILDEPTNALDEESVLILKDILKKERERGATILLSSHNKTDIEELSDKIFKIDVGKVKEV